MKQVIVGGYYNALHITNTEYGPVMGGISWNIFPDARAQTVSTGGTLRKLRVKLDGVPGTGTYTFTLRRRVGLGAWANTALTCTVASGGTAASDTANDISVAAGDVIVLECNPTNPDNARNATWTMEFEGDTANESLLLLITRAFDFQDGYSLVVGYGDRTVEDDVRQVCPTSGVIKNLFVQLDDDPGDAGDGHTFTLRVNGADSSDGGNPLQVAIVSGSQTGNDTIHEITVSAGDILTMSMVRVNTPVFVYASIGMTFVADINGESLILGSSLFGLDPSTTEYHHLVPRSGQLWDASEAQRYQLAQACTFKKFYMLLSSAPSSGKKYTFTVRIATANSNVVVEIADTATTGNSGALEDTVVDGNYVDLMCVPEGTPTIVDDTFWGLVGFITPPGWVGGNPLGVDIATVAKINGVALADIAKVNGIA